MMNFIAISLMLASMAFAGIWSPAPESGAGGGEQVITKGGHRAVVVEYADDSSGQVNTKVSISPPMTSSASLEQQLSSAAAAVAGVSQDAKKAAMEAVGPEEVHGRGPRELICDAFGKCRHKISGAIYKAKDTVSDTAQEVEEGAKEAVDSVIHKAKEASSKATHAAEKGSEQAKRSVSRAKDAVEDTAEEMKQKGRATMGKAGEAVSRAKESAEELKQKGKDTINEAGERARRKGKETTEEMSDIAQRGKEVLYDAFLFLVPKEFFKSLMGLIHLLGFATAYGTATWVTFAMSHLLARSLPRQQFGVVQSRVYPVYFKALASSVGLALLGHLLGRNRRPEVSSVAWRLQVYNLIGSIALVLVNLLFLEPRATKVMYERMKIEKEEGRGVSVQATRLVDHMDEPLTTATATTTTTTTHRREDGGEAKSKMERLNRRLKKLNSYSSLLNVMTLMGLTWHLVYLSQRLCV